MDQTAKSRVAILVLTIAVLFLYFRHSLFATSPGLITAQAVAGALMIWSRLTFGLRSFHGTAQPTAGGLETGGPYRFIRHPIYAAILLFVAAGVLSHVSVTTAAAGVIAAAATAVRIRAEERLLAASYPEYAEYAARTKRLIPFVV